MKLTKTKLKKIIKEELDTVLHEAAEEAKAAEEAIEIGKDMIGTPVGNVVFKALDDDPEFQEALQQAMSQMNEGTGPNYETADQIRQRSLAASTRIAGQPEGEGNVPGQYMALGGMAGAATAAPAIQTAFWGGVLTKSLGPAALGVLKAVGIGVPAIALGAVAAYLIYKGLMKIGN